MMLLPFGVERGVSQGTVFTVWKDKREAVRIRQSSRDGFLLHTFCLVLVNRKIYAPEILFI